MRLIALYRSVCWLPNVAGCFQIIAALLCGISDSLPDVSNAFSQSACMLTALSDAFAEFAVALRGRPALF